MPPAEDTTVDLELVVTGRLPIPHAYAFRPQGGNRLTRLAAVLGGKGPALDARCLAFVVRHPTAGVLLVDTGFHPDAVESVRRDFGAQLALVFRGLRPEPQPWDVQLRALGVDPKEVERVVMTHLHPDHTSGMRLLPRATFTCARDEWRAATSRTALRGGYLARHLPDEGRVAPLDFEADGEPWGPFSATIDLLGDGCVRLVSTPGHTRGHMSVLLRDRDRGEVLLVGDAVYTLRNLQEGSLPFLTWDDDAYLRSLREIRAFADDRPGAVLVPTHDPEAWRGLVPGDGTRRPAASLEA